MTPDIFALFDEIAPARGTYTKADRHREFRAVFLSDERGRRVLNEILTLAHVLKTSVTPSRPVDPFATHFAEGERHVGAQILAILNLEPVEQPARAVTKEPKEQP